jgi:hypothetical protein
MQGSKEGVALRDDFQRTGAEIARSDKRTRALTSEQVRKDLS